ncbi:hypothetical protein MTR_8g027130 [Medicago truncatula]|uniref:Uncharacterized protein n=1 Tax=Medicago truncatula TaxID=3880 RepID=G7LAU2_MEDTR|nr:hypothetical protein MTR_8g027130 [Medicago truncatula]
MIIDGTLRGVMGTVHIEARTTAQAREIPHSYTKSLGNGFMGPLTYKVFNLYSFIPCGTYNSLVHNNTPPQVSPTIHCAPFKRKLLLACIAVAGFSRMGSYLLVSPLMLSPQTDRHCFVPSLLFSVQTDRLPRSYPSSNGALIPLLGHLLQNGLLLAYIAVDGFSANGPTLLCTAVAAFCANGPTASVVPFVQRGSDHCWDTEGSYGNRPHRG